MTMGSARRRKRQGGNELIEFGLISLFLLPLLLMNFVTGLNLVRANQVAHVSRDIGSLYIHGIDFSLDANKALAVRLARGLNLQNNSSAGDGVVILSQVTFIGDATCAANDLTGTECTNRNFYVFTQRLTIGNTGLTTSRIGTPTTQINSGGYVQDYLTDSRARTATDFSNLWNPQLQDGQYAFVTEVYFRGLDMGLANVGNGAVYSRNFF
jgi:hypothetical protein